MAGTWAFIAGAGGDGSITDVSAVNELPVDWTNAGSLPTTAAILIADGANATLGTTTDALSASSTAAATAVSLFKGLLSLREAGNTTLAAIATNTTGWTFSVTVSPLPAPVGQVSVIYSGLSTHFHRGKPPRVFTLHAGTLPTGLTLGSSTGAITGTPTISGVFPGLVIRCTDANTHTADTSPFSITVIP